MRFQGRLLKVCLSDHMPRPLSQRLAAAPIGCGRGSSPCRRGSEAGYALVTILEERPAARILESAWLSETALAQDWNRPEEDEAWAPLQRVP